MQTYDDDVRLGHVVADAADSASLSRFTARRSTGGDADPDEDSAAVETAVRHVLRRARPRDGVLGEDPATGQTRGTPLAEPGAPGSRYWVVHPLQGRESFVRGVPVWATLLALLDGPEVVAAVVSAPALQRRWWAARGSGAWAGRSLSSASSCRVSTVATLDAASLSYASLYSWVHHARFGQFLELARACTRTRAYGDFWSYMLLAEGGIDVAAEPAGSLHDFAAPSLIVSEAGGRFTDLDGGDSPAGGSAISSNGLLHATVLRLFSGIARA